VKKLHLSWNALLKMRREGLTYRQIARKLAVGTMTIWKRFKDHGMAPRKFDEDRVMRLHEQGLSSYQIAKETGYSRPTVNRIRRRHGIDTNSLRTKPRSFKDCPDLGYVLGVFYGDASAPKSKYKSYKIKLSVRDKDFAKEFSVRISRLLGKIPPYPVLSGREKSGFNKVEKEMYTCVAYSKFLWLFLREGNHLPIIDKYPQDFLRGYFDSDGMINVWGGYAQIRFTTSDERVAQMCERALSSIKIHYTRNPSPLRGQIVISIRRQGAIKKFGKEVGSSIERKRRLFFG